MLPNEAVEKLSMETTKFPAILFLGPIL